MNSYWNNSGAHQDLAIKLQALIPPTLREKNDV